MLCYSRAYLFALSNPVPTRPEMDDAYNQSALDLGMRPLHNPDSGFLGIRCFVLTWLSNVQCLDVHVQDMYICRSVQYHTRYTKQNRLIVNDGKRQSGPEPMKNRRWVFSFDQGQFSPLPEACLLTDSYEGGYLIVPIYILSRRSSPASSDRLLDRVLYR